MLGEWSIQHRWQLQSLPCWCNMMMSVHCKITEKLDVALLQAAGFSRSLGSSGVQTTEVTPWTLSLWTLLSHLIVNTSNMTSCIWPWEKLCSGSRVEIFFARSLWWCNVVSWRDFNVLENVDHKWMRYHWCRVQLRRARFHIKGWRFGLQLEASSLEKFVTCVWMKVVYKYSLSHPSTGNWRDIKVMTRMS